jgi:hypothetical protein
MAKSRRQMRNLVELLSNIVQQHSRWLFAILRQELEVELCGYIVAVNEKHIVTAFHKICDDCFRDHFQSADSTDDFCSKRPATRNRMSLLSAK